MLHRVVTTRLFTLGSSLPPWLLARYYQAVPTVQYTAKAGHSLAFHSLASPSFFRSSLLPGSKSVFIDSAAKAGQCHSLALTLGCSPS